ncbi:winged helix-turn-helix transcriptional regulator (plasmid) [Hymenobacter sp. NBH84]|nr:winged helix-turn-helix transcriptional regulator [Hymenobacter sp. NBH84]
MRQNKATLFSTDQQELATVAKALGHPARVAIIRLLATRTTCTCGELVAELPLSQSTVSQHLKELKTAGLVESATDGPRECYCLSPARWAQMRQLFGNVLVALAPLRTER